MEVNEVNLVSRKHTPVGGGQSMAKPGRAGEVVPRTTVYGNTHSNQSVGFSQNF